MSRSPSHTESAVGWREARTIAFDAARRLDAESVALAAAVGRVPAEPVTALQQIPHFDSSAMDGWAVAGEPPWQLSAAASALTSGFAVPIVTGAPMTPGADAVLRSEFGRRRGDRLEVLEGEVAPKPGTHARRAGEEAAAGEILISSGTALNPAHLAVIASAGRDTIRVTARARVALLLTGDEVIETGLPSRGQVRDSFGPLLPPLVEALGGVVVSSQRVSDRRDATRRAIDDAGDVELIISTGGTGGSAADHLRGVLGELDAELLIDRLATRPGAPTILARLPDGRLLAALAGNPLAAIVGLLVTAAPALAGWSGREMPVLQQIVAAGDMPGHLHSTLLSPYRVTADGAVPSDRIGSSMMRGLAEAAGIMSIPTSGLTAGQHTLAMRLPWVV